MKPKTLNAFFSIISDVYNHLYHVEKATAEEKGDHWEVHLHFPEGHHARELAIILDDLKFKNGKATNE